MIRFQPIPSGPRYGASPRERAVSAVLSLVVCLLLAFALVRMGAFDGREPGNGSRLVAIDVSDHASQQARPKATIAHQVTARTAASPVVVPPRPLPSESPLPPLNLIPLSREQMAAADIGRMPRRGPAAGPPAPSAGDSDGAGGGDGPGGAHLYAAEWVREPTRAELATYIPAGANSPGAWAMIACRTIDHFHVERLPRDGREPARIGSCPGPAAGRLAIPGPPAAGKRPADDRHLGAHSLRFYPGARTRNERTGRTVARLGPHTVHARRDTVRRKTFKHCSAATR